MRSNLLRIAMRRALLDAGNESGVHERDAADARTWARVLLVLSAISLAASLVAFVVWAAVGCAYKHSLEEHEAAARSRGSSRQGSPTTASTSPALIKAMQIGPHKQSSLAIKGSLAEDTQLDKECAAVGPQRANWRWVFLTEDATVTLRRKTALHALYCGCLLFMCQLLWHSIDMAQHVCMHAHAEL